MKCIKKNDNYIYEMTPLERSVILGLLSSVQESLEFDNESEEYKDNGSFITCLYDKEYLALEQIVKTLQ